MASGSYDVSGGGGGGGGRRRRGGGGGGGSPTPEGPSSNKPDNTAFTQQRLPAWQPLLSAGTVLPLFLLLGAAFLAVGLGLFFSSQKVQEVELDYTGASSGEGASNCSRCANRSTSSGPCVCGLHFTLTQDFPAPVCLYYQLSNFFQNNRRYSVSRDNEQLSGDAWALRNPITECKPYEKNGSGTPIAPCGAIANSLFNDTFELHRVLDNGTLVPVLMDPRGISWWTDTNVMFRNPEPVNGSLALAFKGTTKPPSWPYPAYDLGRGNPNNTGFVNEHFVVWMRIAALPTFRKLYARIHQGNFSTSLPSGTYYLNITYNYPVLSFHGSKKVILSTLSWMGGKNSFLGIAYLVCGSACFVTGVVMLVVHFKYRHLNEEAG